MDKLALQALLQQAYPQIEFELLGAGCDFQVCAVDEIFVGLTRVQRQQLLNKVLKPLLQDGRLHAVNYQLLTPEEAWANAGHTWTN